MPGRFSRTKFLQENPNASSCAVYDEEFNRTHNVAPGPIKLEPGQLSGKSVLIFGAGVGGLATAYEILAQKSGATVTVLEAYDRTGGRCLSLRKGDKITEDQDSKLRGSKPGETQTVDFEHVPCDSEPYLNAAPGRIPSSHTLLLSYLRKFRVPLEVFVMNSAANLCQYDGSFSNEPILYGQIQHNIRGWLSEIAHSQATNFSHDKSFIREYLDFLVRFGQLTENGKYKPSPGEEGQENGNDRAGYIRLPGFLGGEIKPPISFEDLINSDFWSEANFYQPADFPWQPTLFQPVGGMDKVEKAFARKVTALGGEIMLNSQVERIHWETERSRFEVTVKNGNNKCIYHADYVFSSIAMPFLQYILSPFLKGDLDPNSGLDKSFNKSLSNIYEVQNRSETSGSRPFLGRTCKVGWQAKRSLWQGSGVMDQVVDGKKIQALAPKEESVVPIFGGISWSGDLINQIWYPSGDYGDDMGVLTGAYNFEQDAEQYGKWPIQKRLDDARESASKFGSAFGSGLKAGVSVAWQNMPYIKGGWSQWETLENSADDFNTIAQGSSVNWKAGGTPCPVFFVIGDQMSSLPGWQEGAVSSALNGISRLADPSREIPHVKRLADSRILVQGM